MRHRKIPKNKRKFKPAGHLYTTRNKFASTLSRAINNPPESDNAQEETQFCKSFQNNLQDFLAKRKMRDPEKSLNVCKSSDVSQQEKRARKRRQANQDHLHKQPWETDGQFYARVSRETEEFLQEEYLKIKYDINDKISTDAVFTERSKFKEGKAKKKTLKKTVQHQLSDPGSDLGQRSPKTVESKEATFQPCRKSRQHRKKRLRTKKSIDHVDLLNVKDVVAFGDRVDAPPAFSDCSSTKFRQRSIKAGKKKLILKEALRKSDPSEISAGLHTRSGTSKDLTVKFAGNPAKEQLIREERQRVIESYRAAKRAKRKV